MKYRSKEQYNGEAEGLYKILNIVTKVSKFLSGSNNNITVD